MISTQLNDITTSHLLSESTLDETQSILFHKIETANNSYFIQGKAGPEKSTFIRYLHVHPSPKKVHISCPTALVFLHIRGITLPSLFHLPLKDFFILDELKLKRISDYSEQFTCGQAVVHLANRRKEYSEQFPYGKVTGYVQNNPTKKIQNNVNQLAYGY